MAGYSIKTPAPARCRLHLLALVPLLLALATVVAGAQAPPERSERDAIARIRHEAFDRSQVPSLAHHLIDVIGPRLTGSSGMKAATAWTAATFTGWGLSNVTVESWGEFGRGWENLEYSGSIITPYPQPMPGQPSAWTAGTNGPVTGPVMLVNGGPDSLAKFGDTLRGAFVIFWRPQALDPASRQPRDARIPDDSLRSPTGLDYQFKHLLRSPQPPGSAAALVNTPSRNSAAAPLDPESQKLLDAGVAGVILASDAPDGVLHADARASGRETPVPFILIGREQYNQMYRNVSAGIPVRVRLNILNRLLADDLDAYNTLADLPGGDKADEIVMIGAHLDSWHVGNGATDDGAGVLVMMEAMRILKTLDLHPRRTIRVGLWSGEEQGIRGSRGWVARHRDLWPKITAYFNMDYGTGRIRGIWNQSDEAAIPILDQLLVPLQDLGVLGVHRGDMGGSDHVSFQNAGIPAFFFIQDPIEMWIPSRGAVATHHTSVDVYDHLMLEDLKQAAAVVAALAYGVANRDGLMPRR